MRTRPPQGRGLRRTCTVTLGKCALSAAGQQVGRRFSVLPAIGRKRPSTVLTAKRQAKLTLGNEVRGEIDLSLVRAPGAPYRPVVVE